MITKRLNGIIFGFYDSDEIKKLSVKEITNPLAFDQINRPLINGLYDPAMGVSPYEKFSKCQTCGQEGLNCPGHLGHIQLILPVYNPFLMDKLQKLLQSMCMKCHKLRVQQVKLETFTNCLILTKLGYLSEALEYLSATQNRFLKQQEAQSKQTMVEEVAESDTTRSRRNSDKQEDDKQSKKEVFIFIQFLNTLKNQEIKSSLKKIKKILKLKNVKDKDLKIQNDQAINSQYNKLCQDVFDSVIPGKCPHCGAKQDGIKKEGYSKFFILKKSDDDQEEGKKKLHFLSPIDVRKHIKQLFYQEKELLSLVFGNIIINQHTQQTEFGYQIISNSYKIFFVDVVPVQPNRFRPENKMNDQTFLHQHTVYLTKLLQLNQDLRNIMSLHNNEDQPDQNQKKDAKKKTKLVDVIQKWLEIQDGVNSFFDSSKAQKRMDQQGNGIKQLLEKKEGLFRMKMMGKRVNYAARSVISPDPMLDTNEVGVPLFMAMKLTFPENVNEINHKSLRQLIINGCSQHPGANAIEENGIRISLENRTEQQRIALAKTLLTNSNNKVVYRHLQSGDVLLFNRQPTLHKPSIMSHIARVLPKEQTIRMHYANCNSYNADFDGDEMNLHYLQSFQARAEGYYLSLNDLNYLVPKDGKPIRGLIQDSIFSATYLTMRDTFLDKQQFQQLLYTAVWSIIGDKKIELLPPAILKPKQLWTGKQLVSNIINIIVKLKDDNTVGLNMVGKSRLSGDFLGPYGKEETQIIIRDNELLQGVIDKAAIGNSEFGLVHAFFELYDANSTGKLLSSFSKVFTAFMQTHGFTCGVADLILTNDANVERTQLINVAHQKAVQHLGKHLGLDGQACEPSANLNNRQTYTLHNGKSDLNALKFQPEIDYISCKNPLLNLVQKKTVEEDDGPAELDMEVKSVLNQQTSNILKLGKKGLMLGFPYNYFSGMVQTGAKGSMVNHNQVSLMLGQQELEGRRVPIMPSGRTLPSFLPYDPNPRSGGYITDRFLTGLRPQDFFFHCMAGREGLIDTAVKTSRSGYLQRCLVKHLENLTVQYDSTVRDSDGSVVQFYYGEDGVDVVKNSYLNNYEFIANNYKRYSQKYSVKVKKNIQEIQQKLESEKIKEYLVERRDNPELKETDTIMNQFNPGQHLGAISENAYDQFKKFCSSQKQSKESIFNLISERKLFSLINAKYFNSLAHSGEGVGATAAQSIGEPSTQMTLNTFHLAGHGGANVTLGIPRLREILMTATDKLKTPSMTLYFQDKNITQRQATIYQQKLQKVDMLELVSNIEVHEFKKLDDQGRLLNFDERIREYKAYVTFEDLKAIEYTFGITEKFLQNKIKKNLIPNILNQIQKQIKKSNKVSIIEQAQTQKSIDEEDNDEIEIEEPEQISKDLKNQEDNQVQVGSNQNQKYFDGYKYSKNLLKMKFKVPLNSKKILMLNVLKQTVVNEVKGIQKSHLIKNDENTIFHIQTEGVNFHSIWNEDFVNHKKIMSNDIQAIRQFYGIEAGRNSIIEQIASVFDVYHIHVDQRHLTLIADYMSFSGYIKAMNRTGMNDNASALLRMSFETTMKFLIQASLNLEVDNNKSISSQIVLGRVPKVGTGVFDLRHIINA